MLKHENVRDSDQIKVTFVIPHDPAVPKVFVAGDFNKWDPAATPLVKRSNGTRSVSVMLDPGQRYAYRYYTADGEWFNDEAADDYVINEHGSQNCIVIT